MTPKARERPDSDPAAREDLEIPNPDPTPRKEFETPAPDPAAWEDLELPAMDPKSLLWHFGPGVVLMMTGIGTSHLVTAPAAGGRFQYALLWCIPVAYALKYYGFEMAFRFTNATGKSLIEAYGTAWRKWPVWYLLVTTVIQCAVGQAGRLIAASAVTYFLFTELLGLPIPLAAHGIVLGTLSVGIILRGRYQAVEWASKILAAVLLLASVIVFLVELPPLRAASHLLVVDAPPGSWLIIAALLGLLPTGMDVSLQASEWGKAKRVGIGRIRARLEAAGLASPFDPLSPRLSDLGVSLGRLPPHAREYCRRWFVTGLWDFRIGHLISFLLACIFLLLAAVWLYPSAIEGRAVMGEIARIFTGSVGSGMMVVFLAGAFTATFSTAFNYFDGWPRMVGACCRNLFPATARLPGVDPEDLTPVHRKAWYSEYNLYRATMLFSLGSAVLLIAGFPRPVYLVLIASALAFFIAPVIYFLNLYYCLKVIPRNEGPFFPSTSERWLAGLSLVVFVALTALLTAERIFGIPLLGG